MTAALELWDASQKTIIKEQIAKDCSDGELRLFAQVCAKTGLDPFSRQIYAIKRSGKMTIQTSIDGFRVVAERSREYEGQTPKQWCGADGVWVDVWLSKGVPAAARVGVWRTGFREPLYGVATWAEYAQDSSPMWKKMGPHMLAKCAESLALRAAFPNDLSGLYTSDEMSSADATPRRKVAVDTYDEYGPTTMLVAPPANVDATTGEIMVPADVYDVNDEPAPTRTRRTFAAPGGRSQSAENTERIMAEFTEADQTLATRPDVADLKKRIAALDGFAKDSLSDQWKAAGLPSVAAANAKLTKDQLVEATALVDAAEQAVADEAAAS